jgi:uncharacterized protein (TIGR02265 family)
MGVVFRHTVEGFLEHVVRRQRLFTPEELVALQCEPVRELQLDEWLTLLRASAKRLSPELDEGAALEAVGRAMLHGYMGTLTGPAILLVARLLGPRGAMLRMAESYRTADSTTEILVENHGPTEVQLLFNSAFGVPTYIRGLLSEYLVALRVNQSWVEFAPEPAGVRFTVRWSN